jgi:glycosyltransferase involved in cell wall biosynthesis
VVFTFHTLYERYIDRADTDSDTLRRLAIALPVEFANLCDAVIAPTPAIGEEIRRRGVERPVHVVPTGIDTERFGGGDRLRGRQRCGIPDDAPLLGHIGRLISAKNLDYLARAAAEVLANNERAWLMLVGDGDAVEPMRARLDTAGVAERVVFTGRLAGQELVDAYAALDLFLFTSLTDTQGIVLLEAFSAGVPVVALDATGPCDVVPDGQCGRVIPRTTPPSGFARAVTELLDDPDRLGQMSAAAPRHAEQYHHARCAERLLDAYTQTGASSEPPDLNAWDQMIARTKVEWSLLAEKVRIAAASLFGA